MLRHLPVTLLLLLLSAMRAEALEFVGPSEDGRSFITADSRQPITLWGVNYDHDAAGHLIEDYWIEDWPRVVEDFDEIKNLHANCVRIHLQLGRFMRSPDEVDAHNVAQLAKLIKLAEEKNLYLILTGLGCYHKADVPPWYDALNEHDRWQVQAAFWRAVAASGKDSPAVLAYDLMNEPILPGDKPESEWLGKPLGDKYFVQRLALDRAGRTREEIAQAWAEALVDAIRQVDQQHMITVGVIPWAHYFPGAKPLFYSPEVGRRLDFVSVHFYPKRGKVEQALEALQAYEVGKPLVVEEIFPLEAGAEEVIDFINSADAHVDGWVSFYWGETIDQCKARGDLAGAIQAAWLEQFRDRSPLHPSPDFESRRDATQQGEPDDDAAPN